ncbi:MAG: M28 family peptidase [Bryobacteraceae bacterium]|nr:M28 family peptidase [Bryobacteraceae bacterium]
MAICRAALILAALLPAAAAPFSGPRAFEDTRRIVALGPRIPNSPAHAKMRAYIKAQLAPTGAEIIEDKFTATPPSGPIPMVNLITRFKGTSGAAVVFTGHYDTKVMPGRTFVGANDGGASAGFLVEMARALARQPRKHDVYLVWFDGEEAIGEWNERDGVHGSRHLAQRWRREGVLSRIVALVNVDMIGDKSLGILSEMNSNARLRQLVWQTARDLGHGGYFLSEQGWIEDDHMPFVRLGVPALDLIDFNYGSSNEYWHTEKDTIDKLSPASFAIVGEVLLETLKRLER